MKKKTLLSFASFALASSLFVPSVFADTYTVVSGDSLWKIATKYNVSVTNLQSDNNLTTTNIYPGQILHIPGTADAVPTQSPSTAVSVAKTYTVKSGDTLWSISRTFGVTTDQLMKWNNLTSSNIRVGQVLTVSEPVQIPSLNDSLAKQIQANYVYHIVQTGETFSSIALKYNLTEAQLKSVNTSVSEPLVAGQTLRVSNSKFIRPAFGTYTSGFGVRSGSSHFGIDLASNATVSIEAAYDGVVSRSYLSSSYGEVVFIKHTVDGVAYETVYAHMKSGSRSVKVGDNVKQGQHLGYMGATGDATGQHLHFEIHKGAWNIDKTDAVDPLPYIIK